jgi:hypothetical protein
MCVCVCVCACVLHGVCACMCNGGEVPPPLASIPTSGVRTAPAGLGFRVLGLTSMCVCVCVCVCACVMCVCVSMCERR